MKAIIDSIEFQKQYDTKFGVRYQFKVKYNGKIGSFSSKDKEQTLFKVGEENEFTEEERIWNDQVYYNISPIKKTSQSNFTKNLRKEQSRYSGFACSYVKDLIIAGKIDIKDWEKASEKIFDFMVGLDQKLEK